MDANVKAQWVARLRSGQDKQGTGNLYKDGCFCCLGVLSDIYSKERGIGWTPYPGTSEMYMEGCGGLTPSRVSVWAGFDPKSFIVGEGDPVLPFVDREGSMVALAILNDAGFSFSQLADLIEYFL